MKILISLDIDISTIKINYFRPFYEACDVKNIGHNSFAQQTFLHEFKNPAHAETYLLLINRNFSLNIRLKQISISFQTKAFLLTKDTCWLWCPITISYSRVSNSTAEKMSYIIKDNLRLLPENIAFIYEIYRINFL